MTSCSTAGRGPGYGGLRCCPWARPSAAATSTTDRLCHRTTPTACLQRARRNGQVALTCCWLMLAALPGRCLGRRPGAQGRDATPLLGPVNARYGHHRCGWRTYRPPISKRDCGRGRSRGLWCLGQSPFIHAVRLAHRVYKRSVNRRHLPARTGTDRHHDLLLSSYKCQ